MLSPAEFLAHLDADSHLLAAAAAKGLEPDVPCCPGWTVHDLVVHIAEVQGHKADLVAGGWTNEYPPRTKLPLMAEPVAWFRREAARLYEALAAADPAAPAMTFGNDRTVGFWIRRMAHETLVHRVDAEQSFGYESAVDPELAVDGVVELFDVFVAGYPDWAQWRPRNSVVRVETVDRSWTVRLGRFVGSRKGRDYVLPTTVLEPDAEPNTVISGDPDRVLLWMWGRAPITDVDVTGDISVAGRFRATCARRETSSGR